MRSTACPNRGMAIACTAARGPQQRWSMRLPPHRRPGDCVQRRVSFRGTPSRVLTRDLDVHRLSPFAVELQHQIAEVEAEVVAVYALAPDQAVLVRQGVEYSVEV